MYDPMRAERKPAIFFGSLRGFAHPGTWPEKMGGRFFASPPIGPNRFTINFTKPSQNNF